MLCWDIGPHAVSFFILELGDMHIAVDSASPANHAHVTGLMPVN